jgi:hypothetical protein
MGLADRLSYRVTSQHHVGILARALPPVLKCGGVVRRQPWGRRHDRGPICHTCSFFVFHQFEHLVESTNFLLTRGDMRYRMPLAFTHCTRR